MWWPRPETETDKFIASLLKSGLVDESSLQDARHAVEFQSLKSTELDHLCAHLVANGLLTQWQCDKLRAGKHRGYFVDEWKIIDHIGKDNESTTYLAVNMKSGHRTALTFTWLGGRGRPMEYTAVDLGSEQ